ncbi:DUF1496 domain-containing protein [Thaumasiovibrio sp. DFM-14]|uniref:DUF1496 domain-containing protein n=1 Tax=Thaumasiovibrio sp. DFM-14 TaxID=3384792 RepID=UPI0039A1F751
MRHVIMVVMLCASSASWSAQPLATSTVDLSDSRQGKSKSLKIEVDGQRLAARACYYDDKQYSLGSVLALNDVLIECVPENSFETNGALRWQRLE